MYQNLSHKYCFRWQGTDSSQVSSNYFWHNFSVSPVPYYITAQIEIQRSIFSMKNILI